MGDFPRKADGRQIFTVEFKRGVVQQILRGEKTLAELARELDIQVPLPSLPFSLEVPLEKTKGASRCYQLTAGFVLVAGARNRQTVHLPALQPIEMTV